MREKPGRLLLRVGLRPAGLLVFFHELAEGRDFLGFHAFERVLRRRVSGAGGELAGGVARGVEEVSRGRAAETGADAVGAPFGGAFGVYASRAFDDGVEGGQEFGAGGVLFVTAGASGGAGFAELALEFGTTAEHLGSEHMRLRPVSKCYLPKLRSSRFNILSQEPLGNEEE